jgi:DNA (cytosine-5)-methyltransferase 1
VIESEKFGIPQRRHRVILLGVRVDLDVPSGLCLKPQPAPNVCNVLSDLPAVRSQLSRGDSGPESWARAIREAYAAFDGDGVEKEARERMDAALRCLRVTAGVGGGRFRVLVPYRRRN